MSLLDETWKPDFLIARVMEIDDILKLTKRLIAENPDDGALKVSLRQDEAHRVKVVECLHRSLVEYRQHSVSYIFKDATPGAISLDTFLNGLQAFSSLVSSTFKELCGSRMDLQFNTTFAGSFGVLLSTPFDEQFLESDFDRGLTAVFDTIEKIGEEGTDTKDLLKKNLKGNRDLIHKFTNFFNGIVKTGSPVEIRWQGLTSDQPRSAFVPIERARRLHDLFAEHAKRDPETLILSGQIKGISLLRNVIDIQYMIKGKQKPKTMANIPFSPELTALVKSAFDISATLTIQIDYDYNDLTGMEVQHRSLIGVSIPNSTK